MSLNFRYFPDIFEDFVVNTRPVIDPTIEATIDPIVAASGGVLPIFKFGSYLELVALTSIDRSAVKYPLVWLVWDSNENTQNWVHSQRYTISPRIFICTPRNPTALPEYAFDNYFKLILYPIWVELEKQITYHDNVATEMFNKVKINEHSKWGENYTNKLFDTLSALEINFDELQIIKRC